MVPELPEIPEFPVLHWSYSEGLYSLEENDVDKLLDYGENRLPLFRFELDQYSRKLNAVLSRMALDLSQE